MPNNRIVHIVDDDQAVCQALGLILGCAGHGVRLHSSAFACLEALPDPSAGCIVTDMCMPGMNGLEFQQRLKALGISLPIIMLTGNADVALAVEALKAGAFDFIEKPMDTRKLLAAVAAALEYGAKTASRSADIDQIQECLTTLSKREREVLDGLVAGHANKVIGQDLGISPRTIEIYRAKLMRKMGAHSISELVQMAVAVAANHGIAGRP